MKYKIHDLAGIVIIFVIILIVAVFIIDSVNYVNFGTKKGEVIDKEYHAAYVTYTSSYVNNGVINIPVQHPEKYSIKLKKVVNGKEKTVWIDVSKEAYEKVKIGDIYGGNK